MPSRLCPSCHDRLRADGTCCTVVCKYFARVPVENPTPTENATVADLSLPLSLRSSLCLRELFATNNLKDIDAIAFGDTATHTAQKKKLQKEALGRCQSMCVRLTDPPFLPFERDSCDRVQMFDKPAAGEIIDLDQRRPPRVLDAAMKHLSEHILFCPSPDWSDLEFEKFNYLWDRFRQIRQDWTAQYDKTHRRKKWLEFMVRVFAIRVPVCSRTYDDCCRILLEKFQNAETLQDCFGQLLAYYRNDPQRRDADLISAFILFCGLQLLSKTELTASWMRTYTVPDEVVPSKVRLEPEPPSESVDLPSVYIELMALGSNVSSPFVHNSLLLLQSLFEGEWLRFMQLCRALPLTFLQRCFVFHSFTYVRFRAIFDIVTKGVRGEVLTLPLSRQLLFDSEKELLSFLSIMEVKVVPSTVDSGHGAMCIRVTDETGKNRLLSSSDVQALLDLEQKKPYLSFPPCAAFFGFDEITDNLNASVDMARFLKQHYPPFLTAELHNTLRQTGGMQEPDIEDEFEEGEQTASSSDTSEFEALSDTVVRAASPQPHVMTLSEFVEQLIAASTECLSNLRCSSAYSEAVERSRRELAESQQKVMQVFLGEEAKSRRIFETDEEVQRLLLSRLEAGGFRAAMLASTERKKCQIRKSRSLAKTPQQIQKAADFNKEAMPTRKLPAHVQAPAFPTKVVVPPSFLVPVEFNHIVKSPSTQRPAEENKAAVRKDADLQVIDGAAASQELPKPEIAEPWNSPQKPEPCAVPRPQFSADNVYRAMQRSCARRAHAQLQISVPRNAQNVFPIDWGTPCAAALIQWYLWCAETVGIGHLLRSPASVPINLSVMHSSVFLGLSVLLVGDLLGFVASANLSHAVAEILSSGVGRAKYSLDIGSSFIQSIFQRYYQADSGRCTVNDCVASVECTAVDHQVLPLLELDMGSYPQCTAAVQAESRKCFGLVVVESAPDATSRALRSLQFFCERSLRSSGILCFGLVVIVESDACIDPVRSYLEKRVRGLLPFVLVPLSEALRSAQRKRHRKEDAPSTASDSLRELLKESMLELVSHCLGKSYHATRSFFAPS